MTLTIDIDDALAAELAQQAEAEGATPSNVAAVGIRHYLSSLQKSAQLETALRGLRERGASLGRNGRSWREMAHEGHKY